jgi:hypothetical protein
MIDILLHTSNLAYSIALTIVLTIVALDVILMIVGMGLMGALESLHIDTDLHLDFGGFNQLANWACVNKVPFVVWLLLALTGFGLAGLTLNFIAFKLMGFMPQTLFTVPFALFGCFYFTHVTGNTVARLMPKENSTAQTVESFKGSIAHITIGTASKGNPAEAQLTDGHNQRHFVSVVPLNDGDTFTQDEQVVLIEQQDDYWLCHGFDDLMAQPLDQEN